jgi:hypothetical protein
MAAQAFFGPERPGPEKLTTPATGGRIRVAARPRSPRATLASLPWRRGSYAWLLPACLANLAV